MTLPARRTAKPLLQPVTLHVALFATYYNFVRIHKTLRVTPAMAAGVTNKLWDVTDIVSVLEKWEFDRQVARDPHKTLIRTD
jgi:hypothetical protein